MKKLPWYQNLQIIAWSAGGLTAAGALIVGTARYINLPREVEAAVQKNELQDEAILELKKSNEIWQGIYQQQQAPNSPQREEWQDDRGRWWCCDRGCNDERNWFSCE